MIFKKNPEDALIDLFFTAFEAKMPEVRVYQDGLERVTKLQFHDMIIRIEYRYSTILSGGPTKISLTKGYEVSINTEVSKYLKRAAKLSSKRKKAIYYEKHLAALKDLTGYINRTIGD